MLGLDSTPAQAFNPTYRMVSGLLSNISDSAGYELRKLWTEQQVDKMVSTYLLDVAGSPEELRLEVQHINEVSPGACTFAGPYKATVNLAFVEPRFNCEKVAVEFSSEGLLALFAEFEYAFEGRPTVFVGAKAGIKAGPLNVGPSLKGGLDITEGPDGTFKDGGSVPGAADLGAKVVGDDKPGAGAEVEAESGCSALLSARKERRGTRPRRSSGGALRRRPG